MISVTFMRRILMRKRITKQALLQIFIWHSSCMEPKDLYALLLDRDKTTTNALAAMLGDQVDQSQLHRFEKGKTKEPRRTTLKPVADHWGLPVEVFYDSGMADVVAANVVAKRPLLTGIGAAAAGAIEQAVAGPDAQINRTAKQLAALLYKIPADLRVEANNAVIDVLIGYALGTAQSSSPVPPGRAETPRA